MDVILLERIDRLGQMGDVVKVKSGYARNYLLPQKKALRATPDNLAYFGTRRAELEAANIEHREEAEKVSAKLDGYSAVLIRQAGESGQLYGSVTTRDIAAALTEAGFVLERRQVQLERPIKALGIYDVRVSLHPEVTAAVSINVAKSAEEAQIQLREAKEAEAAARREAETKPAKKKPPTEAAEATVESASAEEAAQPATDDDKPARKKGAKKKPAAAAEPGDDKAAAQAAEGAAEQSERGPEGAPAAEDTAKTE